MKLVLIIVGSFAALVLLFVVWSIYHAITGSRRAYLRLAARIAPVVTALAAGREPDPHDLFAYARDRVTRKVLYDALEFHKKLHLFPKEFFTCEAMAEADLVAWLFHPNELGSPPDEIELTMRIPAPSGQHASSYYFLFKYRMMPPHWAAKDGWMAGVAGPYDLKADPVSSAPGTFSRFEAYDSRKPEEHVLVTHRLVVERKAS